MQKVEAKLKGDKGKGASSAASTKKKKKADQKDKDKQKAFFAEVANADELIHTRRKIATFSLARAKERIAKEKAVRESRQSVNDEKSDNDKKDSDDNVKEETDSSSKNGGDENEKSTYKNMDTSDSNDNDTTNDNNDDENQSQTTSHINSVDVDVLEYRAHKHLLNTLQTYQNYSSEIGDLRPISSVKFSPDSSYLLTSSWSGDSKLWNIPDGQHLATLKGHTERVTDIQWHPRAGVSQVCTCVWFLGCLWGCLSARACYEMCIRTYCTYITLIYLFLSTASFIMLFSISPYTPACMLQRVSHPIPSLPLRTIPLVPLLIALQGRDSVNIASCGVDRRINLYALPEAYEFSQAYVYASEGESSDEADESDSGMKVEDATDDDSDDAAMLMDDEDKDNETESSAKAKIRSRKAKLLEARKRKESKGAPCLRPMASLVGHTDRISRYVHEKRKKE